MAFCQLNLVLAICAVAMVEEASGMCHHQEPGDHFWSTLDCLQGPKFLCFVGTNCTLQHFAKQNIRWSGDIRGCVNQRFCGVDTGEIQCSPMRFCRGYLCNGTPTPLKFSQKMAGFLGMMLAGTMAMTFILA